MNSTFHTLGYISVLRNPIDRLMSQLFFFTQSLQSLLEQNGATYELNIYRTILTNPKNVSASALHDLFVAMGMLGSTIHHPTPYEMVLSRSKFADFKPSKGGLEIALQSVSNDLMAVGTTESLSTFFVLVARLFGRNVTTSTPAPTFEQYGGGMVADQEVVSWRAFNLTEACHLYLQHGRQDTFPLLRRFGNPSADRVFNGPALKELRGYLKNEVTIWEAASRLHDQQLQAVGLTRQSALRVWERTCAGVPRVTTQKELKRYRYHNMRGIARRKRPVDILVENFRQALVRKKEHVSGKQRAAYPGGSQTKQQLYYHRQWEH